MVSRRSGVSYRGVSINQTDLLQFAVHRAVNGLCYGVAGISASSATVSPRYLLIAVILAFSLLVLIILLLLCVIQRSRTGTYRGTATAARCISVKACSQHTN